MRMRGEAILVCYRFGPRRVAGAARDSFFLPKMADSANETELLLDDSPSPKQSLVVTRVAGSVKKKASHDVVTIPIEDWNDMKDQNARILAQLSQHDFDSTRAQSEKNVF